MTVSMLARAVVPRLLLCLSLLLVCSVDGLAGAPSLLSQDRADGPPAALTKDRSAWWSEPPDLSGRAITSEIISQEQFESEVANDFYSAGPATIIECVWWGKYYSCAPCDPNVTTFNLRFLYDGGGLPYGPFAEYLSVTPTQVIYVGEGTNGPIYEYHASVSVDVDADYYWFSVQAADHTYPPDWGRLSAEVVTHYESAFRCAAWGYPDWIGVSDVFEISTDASQAFYTTPPTPGACCFADWHCESLSEGTCQARGGIWHETETVCDPNPCQSIPLACCFPNGSCELRSQIECAAVGGSSVLDTSCEPNPCPQPPGACCFADAQCAILPQADCTAQGGTAWTEGGTCDPNTCPMLVGACCFFTGRCVITTEDRCTGLSAWFGSGTVCAPGMCVQPGATSILKWGEIEDVPLPNEGFVAIAAGEVHALGLKEDSSIVAFGINYNGECDVPEPNTGFVKIAAGGNGGSGHSLGLTADGMIIGWGANWSGQAESYGPDPDFADIAAGGSHSLVLMSYGAVYGWGSNTYGQCNTPSPNTGFVDMAAGAIYSIGLKSNGSVVLWGSSPGNPPGANTGFVAIAAGNSHALALKADGSIVAWGNNYSGQCDVPSPNRDFVAIAAGAIHSLGVKSDGRLVAWGSNWSGQLNVPNSGFLSAAAGYDFSVGQSFILPGACCFADGHCVILLEAECTEQSGATWTFGQPCDPNGCPQPGACCFADGACAVLLEAACTAQGGTGWTLGGTCEPNACPQPGACCFADDHCAIVTQGSQCIQQGGVWLGPETVCDPNPCPGIALSCCLPDGGCQLLTRTACTEAGGLQWGADPSCDPNPCPPPGTTYYVRPDGTGDSPPYFPNIQAAIDFARSGDEIQLMDGTFSGSGNCHITFRGKAIRVYSANGPSQCTIDGGMNGQVVSFSSGEGFGSVLEGVTVTHGDTFGGGSGIGIGGSSPTIRNCWIVSNFAEIGYGGGIGCGNHAFPLFDSCVISNNGAGGYHGMGGGGGGLYADATSRPTLQDCDISDNSIFCGSGYECAGGGIYCEDAILIRCTVRGNYRGGAIHCGPARIQDCVVSGNVYNTGIVATGATIQGCTIAGNAGGISGSGLEITNCVVTGNGSSGGIRCGDSSITGCTVSGNGNYDPGGGVQASNTHLTRTIVYGNCRTYPQMADEITSNGGVTLTCCAVNRYAVFGAVIYDGVQVYTDPLFCDPRACTQAPTTEGNYRLRNGSPCLPAVSPCGELIGALWSGCTPADAPEEAEPAIPIPRIFPNPTFGPITAQFALRGSGPVRMDIYDVGGRLVKAVANHDLARGAHAIAWDGRDAHGEPVPAGVYLCVLRVDRERIERQIVILK